MGLLKPTVDASLEVTLLTTRLQELCQELDLALREAEQQRKRLSNLRDRATLLLHEFEGVRTGGKTRSA